MFTDAMLVLAAIFLCVLLWSTNHTARVTAEKAQTLVEEETMFSATWKHKPAGSAGCITITVSDQDFEVYKTKKALALTDTPVTPDCDCP